LQRWWNRLYVEKKIRPQFDELGVNPSILNPHTLQITGKSIYAGDYIHIISNRAQPVALTSWRSKQHRGTIQIGDFCLISPGVQIASAQAIRIGNNCMLAAEVLISDCDWHGVYNRVRPFRCTAPVRLEDNVWIGTRAIILKGVNVGQNSIIGAGSVVVNDVPPNTIVAGNPAEVVKTINPKRKILTREFLFQQENNYWSTQHRLEDTFSQNSIAHWLRTWFYLSSKD